MTKLKLEYVINLRMITYTWGKEKMVVASAAFMANQSKHIKGSFSFLLVS